jgi:6-phosphogluconolactonase
MRIAMETVAGERADLDDRGAHIVAEAIAAGLASRPHVVLGVVGGRSVSGIYRRLAALDLPWPGIHVFLADERLVPITSDESNWRVVRGDLLEGPLARGALPAANAHAFELDAGAPDCGASRYSSALLALGGRFDVAILSAGEDGHCASLFPGHPSVADESEHFVVVKGSPKPPPRRLSASRRLLERSRVGLMVFYGEDKRAALARFRDPAIDVLACPSKVVAKLDHGYLLTDLS